MQLERSYRGYAEDYTVRVEADRPLLKLVSEQVHQALDIGVGTGTGIEDMIDMGVVIKPFTIIGVDLDENNLAKARQNKHIQIPIGSENKIIIEKGDAENLVSIEDNTQELILCRNMIHLTNAPRVFSEMYRVLKPGGITLISSGYIRDLMYPPPVEVSKARWGLILALARMKLIKEYGYKKENIPDPNLPDKYNSESLTRISKNTGFINLETNITDDNPNGQIVELGANAIQGLINWGGFAEGAIPIADVDLAKKVMSEALKHERLLGKKFPRGFFYLKAQKPF